MTHNVDIYLIGFATGLMVALIIHKLLFKDFIFIDEALEVLLEVDPWMPIETAPGNREFLALSCERDHIELLTDDGVDGNFFNLNSGNYTKKTYWSHWMERPVYPKT
jgi:hypothetical protein